jgi:hypothetical protein
MIKNQGNMMAEDIFSKIEVLPTEFPGTIRPTHKVKELCSLLMRQLRHRTAGSCPFAWPVSI